MFEDVRERLALAQAARAVRRRTARVWRGPLQARRLLVVLPDGEAALHAAWTVVRETGVAPERVVPVALVGPVAYIPDGYVGRVRLLGPGDRNRLGVPRRAIAQAIWVEEPDVAIDLSTRFNAAAAFLVGASPAALRVGFYNARAEPFYDLLVAPGAEGGADAVGRYLSALDPPALPFGVSR